MAGKNNQFMPTQFLYSLYDTSVDSRYDATFKSEFYATRADANIGLKEGDLRLLFPNMTSLFTSRIPWHSSSEHFLMPSLLQRIDGEDI